MKILFINNYAMDKAWKSWKNGEYPGNHLWGITHLHKYGIDVDILPHEKYVILNKIGRHLKLGNYLDQQLRILLNLSHYDLVYSACGSNTFLLAFLRCLGIFRKPLVAIIHRNLDDSRKNRIFIKGHDRLLCLSNKIREHIEDKFDVDEIKLEVLEWAVDVPFYKKINTIIKPDFILSVGKTQRDYDTLVKAFSKINYPLRIYCSEKSAPPTSEVTSNVLVQFQSLAGALPLSFIDLCTEYEKAYLVAIPLEITSQNANSVTMIGLTSLLEAMVMRKAVVMTRNKYMNIDIEKEKMGIWVEPGDVEGWQQAITYLLAHPDETLEMGNRGRHLCESKYNLEIFSSRLAKILLEFRTPKSG